MELPPSNLPPYPQRPMPAMVGNQAPLMNYPAANMGHALRPTPPEQDEKKKEFSKGIFVSGF